MNATPEILEQLEQLGGLFFSPTRCARILQLDAEALKVAIMNTESDFHKAYYRGFDKADVEYRQMVMKMANQGSQPAQESLSRIIKHAKSELDE